MEYRLLCVYKCNRKVVEQVDIEVNREMGSTHLAPFIRNISVEDLAYSALNSPRELVYLLNQCGFIKQPFILSPKVLAFSSVQKVITENGWTYGKEGHGSLKKTEPIQIKATASSLPLGVLNGGELYIQDAVHWKDHIKIRLIYDNAIVPFFPVYNELPCRTISNTYFKRNPVAEAQLLHDLEPFIDENKLEMSLPTYDVNFLKLLADKHWKIYIEGQKKQRSEVYAHQSQSGIVWFDKNEHVDDENGIVSQLLNSYLQGRNYKEVGSNIYLYRSNDVIKQDREAITAGILPDGEALKDIYTDNTLLSDNEKEYIESKVKQGVAATLRPYQREGVRWLATMRKNQKGCLLADEMGLGKTLQVLAHLYSLKAPKGPFLIIAPTSLLPNWENEIKKFIPSWADHIDIQDHNPNQAKQIILVSYDILRLNISVYKKLYYDTIVIDEAQIVKNRDTKKYQTIKQLKAYHRIILTGTPIENSLSDIWSHFMILIPSLSRIFKTITKNKVSIDSPQFMELSKKLLKPFILRRTKDEEMKNMPELKVKNVCIELTPRERSIYNHVKALFLKALQTGVSGRMNSIVLEGLQRLRQTCISSSLLPSSINHNALFMSSKMKSALELIKKSIDNGEKVLVFSQFVKALEELDRYLTERALGHVHLYGDTTNRKACIDAFQHDDRIKVFLISLKAGGVGLNLTAANSVILLDDWWNPAVEDQAFARAHRIGQEHEVTVYRLVCKNTVEQKILQLQEQKRKTVDIFNASGSKLTMEEIKNLID